MEEKETKVEKVEEITKKEEKMSIDTDFYDKKEKGKVIRIIWNVIFYAFLAVFAVCAIFGVINFNKVKDNAEPFGYATTKTYEKDAKTVTVYNYYAYKIVKVNENGKSTVSLKLWFLDDIK